MSLTRAALSADLWGALQRQFQEAGILNEDSTGNLKEPLDRTLLALGVSYGDLAGTGDLVADGDEYKALVVARYYGLHAVYDAALNAFDETIDAPNVSIKRSPYVANLERALTRARDDAAPYMTTVDSGWGVGAFSLDINEPYATE